MCNMFSFRSAACDNSVLSGSPRLNPPPPPSQSAPVLTLSELPEPPIPVSEIGPIPPPPMFSSPSPTPTRFNHMHHKSTTEVLSYEGNNVFKIQWNPSRENLVIA